MPPGIRVIVVSALCAVDLVCLVPASAGEHAVRRAAAQSAIVCLAGCRSGGPEVVGHSPNLPADPLLPVHVRDGNLVLRDVWCGNTGSCIALNHIAPPHLRDENGFWDGSTSVIAVFDFR